MARREIVPSNQETFAERRQARRVADRQAELWQGYAGSATCHAGWEISVQTSRCNFAPLVMAGVILVAIVALVGYGTPSHVRPNELPQGPAMFLAGLGTAALLGLPLAFLYGQFPKLMRHFELERVEIRPDGIAINAGTPKEGFFGRDEVLTIGIEVIDGEPAEFRFGLAGVIGTRRLVLLRGLDDPTAQRLKNDIEIARRTLWA